MRAKKTKTAVRRSQIAEAALGLVERHGFQGLNFSRLADAVGVVPSGLYRHYTDKDRIIEAVVDLIQQRLEANVAQVRGEAQNALLRLKTLLDLHVRLVLQKSFIPRVVFSEEVLAGNCLRGRLVVIKWLFTPPHPSGRGPHSSPAANCTKVH
jgi:AcrR family transcriptional regulator